MRRKPRPEVAENDENIRCMYAVLEKIGVAVIAFLGAAHNGMELRRATMDLSGIVSIHHVERGIFPIGIKQPVLFGDGFCLGEAAARTNVISEPEHFGRDVYQARRPADIC